jgi:hypothetical protein
MMKSSPHLPHFASNWLARRKLFPGLIPRSRRRASHPAGAHGHHDDTLADRRPFAALGLALGASILAGTAWTALMLWLAHR